MHWVLIAIFTYAGNGVSLDHIPNFNSQGACLNAGNDAKRAGVYDEFLCEPEG